MDICSIAIIYKRQGKFLEALELHRESLATKKNVLGCELVQLSVWLSKHVCKQEMLALLVLLRA